MIHQKLTLKDIATELFIAPVSASRYFTPPKKNIKHPHNSFDPTFPKPEKIGRSVFIDSNQFYKWLSKKAGTTISPDDALMTTKHVQDYYQKSHTWVWLNVKAGNLPKPFKINRTNYWLTRDIVGEVEEDTNLVYKMISKQTTKNTASTKRAKSTIPSKWYQKWWVKTLAIEGLRMLLRSFLPCL